MRGGRGEVNLGKKREENGIEEESQKMNRREKKGQRESGGMKRKKTATKSRKVSERGSGERKVAIEK